LVINSAARLPLADDFRTLRWEEVFKYPEVVLGQMRDFEFGEMKKAAQ